MFATTYTPSKRRTKKEHFTKLPTTKKGSAGEKILTDWFISKGYVLMSPANKRKPHIIDLCFIHPTILKPFLVDVKVASERDYYADNGMDTSDYETYLKLSETMPVYVAWIDEKRRSVYWIQINEESAAHAKKEGAKVYFDLQHTKVLFTLSWSQIETL